MQLPCQVRSVLVVLPRQNINGSSDILAAPLYAVYFSWMMPVNLRLMFALTLWNSVARLADA